MGLNNLSVVRQQGYIETLGAAGKDDIMPHGLLRKGCESRAEPRLNSDIELDLDGAKCSGSVAELLRSIKSRRMTLVIWLI